MFDDSMWTLMSVDSSRADHPCAIAISGKVIFLSEILVLLGYSVKVSGSPLSFGQPSRNRYCRTFEIFGLLQRDIQIYR